MGVTTNLTYTEDGGGINAILGGGQDGRMVTFQLICKQDVVHLYLSIFPHHDSKVICNM